MAEENRVPRREEVPAEYRWRVEDLFAGDGEWEREYRRAEALLPRLAEEKRRVGESGAGLLAVLRLRDEALLATERLLVYARLRRDEDNTNQVYQALTARAADLAVRVETALSFLAPAVAELPGETLERWLAEEEGLAVYRHFLDEIRRQKEHLLSPAEEALLAAAGELAEAPDEIFGMLTNADLEFPSIKDDEGRELPVSQASLGRLLEHRSRRVREEAFRVFYEGFGRVKQTLTAAYFASVKKDRFYARARRYESALAAALDADNIPAAVYDNLIASVRGELPALHRYQELRRRVLGLEELHVYDLYVPLVPAAERDIPYAEARETVRRALSPLGREYGEILERAFRERWIDVLENRGKTSGAYSWGAYGTHPYVLLNYQQNTDSLFTLAHELGHALHSFFSDRAQAYVNSHYRIFVAEVASTLNEYLLLRHLLADDPGRDFRLYLLNHFLEEIRGTVFRQTMFAEFERATHRRVEEGEALTLDWLNETYRGLLRAYYGPGVTLDEGIEREWARIPHFYNAFYVYKYATGMSAALALGQQILAEGEPAVRRYLEFLESGGSDYPLELLRRAGVDLTTPQPVRAALAVFRANLEELERELAAG